MIWHCLRHCVPVKGLPSLSLIHIFTPQIMTVVDRGQYSVACAYASIMMLIVYAAIALMQIFVNRMRRSRRVKGQEA